MSLESKRRFLEHEEFGPDPMKCTIYDRTYHGNHLVHVPYITEIAPNLYQGGCDPELVLPEFIKNVVSLYPWERYLVKHQLDSFLEVAMYDDASFNKEYVDQIASWAASRVLDGPATLIHCQMGLNRSSMVTVRVLQSLCLGKEGTGNMTVEDAIALVREKRSPACLCNPAMEAALRNW